MKKIKNNYMDNPDNVQYSILLKWLNEDVVKKISFENKEPLWMLELRLKSLKIFFEKPLPIWGPNLNDLNFDNIVFYAKPWNRDNYATNWKDLPEEIKNKFEKLWIPESERKYLAWAWWQFDSETVYHKIKEKWLKKWIIFEDMNKALIQYEDIIKKHFMKLVPPSDHKFAALHWAVWSWWTFIHIPDWVVLDEPLQAYFRMNTESWWQFEHTLIIVWNNSECNYIEWCSAPKFNKRAMHAWCVEIFVWENSKMRYSSVENWSIDTYNLNTKRAIVEKNSFMEWIWWNFGSWKTMLYPMSILKWENSRAEHLWVAFATNLQEQDTWAKVLHIWKNSSSKIISKSISKSNWINTYRWIVDITKPAINSINTTQCDALLIDKFSISNTYPDIKVKNNSSTIAHEANAWKIDEDYIFYLMSKWISKDEALWLIVNWFINPIIKKLPLEYAWELNRLIELEMEGSVW